MTASRALSFALGLALAAPIAAYAYEGASPQLRHRHHHSPVYHRAVDRRAASPASVPEGGTWSASNAALHRQYRIEGLTRDPNACVKYGCIGNN
jgi:hypothetical protein